jgi:hypothetical protein
MLEWTCWSTRDYGVDDVFRKRVVTRKYRKPVRVICTRLMESKVLRRPHQHSYQ